VKLTVREFQILSAVCRISLRNVVGADYLMRSFIIAMDVEVPSFDDRRMSVQSVASVVLYNEGI